jgi:hypothetical protein
MSPAVVYKPQIKLTLSPVSLREANAFIEKHHRHHGGRRAHRFAVGVRGPRGGLRGVAIAGNPIAKALCDGRTIEVSRSCTDGTKNVNSMLYGAIWRAARALGYTRMITYTMPSCLPRKAAETSFRGTAKSREN